MTFDSEEQRQAFLALIAGKPLLTNQLAALEQTVADAKIDPPWEPEHKPADMEWLKKQAANGFWCYD